MSSTHRTKLPQKTEHYNDFSTPLSSIFVCEKNGFKSKVT